MLSTTRTMTGWQSCLALTDPYHLLINAGPATQNPPSQSEIDAVEDMLATHVSRWPDIIRTRHPGLSGLQQHRAQRAALGTGTMLVDALTATIRNSAGTAVRDYPGVPLGPLATVNLYGANIIGKGRGVIHGVGCTHHPLVNERTETISLPEALDLPRQRESTAPMWFQHRRCSRCAGASCDRLNAEQFAYLMNVRRVLQHDRTLDLSTLPAELASWAVLYAAAS